MFGRRNKYTVNRKPRVPDLNQELNSKLRDELNLIARKRHVAGYRSKSKPELIAARLQLGEATVRKSLNITWWDRYHNHVYGVVTIIGCLLAIIPFLPTTPPPDQLRVGDFQLQLFVSAHARAAKSQYQPPDGIKVFSNIGGVFVESVLRRESPVARDYPSIKNPTTGSYFIDKAPLVKNLAENRAVEDLIGKQITSHIPIQAFGFDNGPVYYQLHMFIKGREIVLRAESNGDIDVVVTEEMVKGVWQGVRPKWRIRVGPEITPFLPPPVQV